MKKHTKYLWIPAVLLLIALGTLGLYRSQSPTALQAKKYMKYNIFHMHHDTWSEETEGLSRWCKMSLFVDEEKTTDFDYDESSSLNRVYWTRDVTRLVNYHDGYQMDFPRDTEFDFSQSACQITARGDGYQFTVTKEYSLYLNIKQEMTDGLALFAPGFPYEDGVDQYIGYYQSRFLLNQTWQENNQVNVTPVEIFDANGHKGFIYHAVIENMAADRFDAYSYLFVRYADQDYLRILVKYDRNNTELRDSLPSLFSDFRIFEPLGPGMMNTDFAPSPVDEWSDETRQWYSDLSTEDLLHWGIYTDDMNATEIPPKLLALEEQLDYHFDVVLTYVHSTQGFPMDLMKNAWDQGRIVELTYQLTENNNEDMRDHSPLLDIYRGLSTDEIRSFAREARRFGHPFLFRLCNEMNSDWTSYGGINNMADPEIFVTVWQEIYQIFQEEHVDNCIWIFNPNDRNCPPSKWNDAYRYYPGNDYVQMFGITGYNNGTYYTKWEEEWREFDVIYDALQALNEEYFGEFPWIITEFASSSYGGDKVGWIDGMFDALDRYPNIKIAVWFNAADYDTDGTPARPYWLDETPDTLEAFRRGLHQTK